MDRTVTAYRSWTENDCIGTTGAEFQRLKSNARDFRRPVNAFASRWRFDINRGIANRSAMSRTRVGSRVALRTTALNAVMCSPLRWLAFAILPRSATTTLRGYRKTLSD